MTSEQVGVTQSALRIAGLCRSRKANGRAIYDPGAKRSLIALCQQPGISVARAALENGINANLLRKWIRASQRGIRTPKRSPSTTGAALPRQASSAPGAPALLPVVLAEPTAAAVRESAADHRGSIEVVLARGTLRLSNSVGGTPCIDRLLLTTLIELLSQAPSLAQA